MCHSQIVPAQQSSGSSWSCRENSKHFLETTHPVNSIPNQGNLCVEPKIYLFIFPLLPLSPLIAQTFHELATRYGGYNRKPNKATCYLHGTYILIGEMDNQKPNKIGKLYSIYNILYSILVFGISENRNCYFGPQRICLFGMITEDISSLILISPTHLPFPQIMRAGYS